MTNALSFQLNWKKSACFSLTVTKWRAACEGWTGQASWAASECEPLLPFWLKCSSCKCEMWGRRLWNEALKWFYLADIIELRVIIKISSSVWKWTSALLLLRRQYHDHHRHHHHHCRHYLRHAAEPYLMTCKLSLRLSPYHPASWRRRRAPHSHCCQIFPQHAPEKKIWLVSRILYWCATLFLEKDV